MLSFPQEDKKPVLEIYSVQSTDKEQPKRV